MQRIMLQSKIHRATITDANLNYEGSITIDQTLLELANITPFEQVQIYNISNGERFETYAITGPRNSGVMCVNGAAARKVAKGDLIIIANYALMEANEAKNHVPRLVYVDEQNRPLPKMAAISNH